MRRLEIGQALPLLAALTLAACSGSGATLLSETATFGGVTLHSAGGPCPTGKDCSETITVQSGGVLEYRYDGRDFRGQLPASDLKLVADLSTAAPTVEQLRQRMGGCPSPTDHHEVVTVGVGSNLFVSGENNCPEGPVVSLAQALRHLARKVFADSGAPAVTLPAVPAASPARLQEVARLMGFSLVREGSRCPPTDYCGERLSVDVDEGGLGSVSYTAPGLRRVNVTGVADLSPLAAAAVSPAVITELRKMPGCPSLADVSEVVTIEVGASLFVRAETGGCTSGPVADLRAAARALVDRLPAQTVSDAGIGTPDHPPDTR